MKAFEFYFKYGVEHILSPEALDHLLFLLVLALPYTMRNLWQIAILATGFTIGHSLTLALTAKQWILTDTYWIELAIPLTIIISGLYNFIQTDVSQKPPQLPLPIILNTTFGLVHGMGFAGMLTALLGKEDNLLEPLLAFNLGIELAQVVVLAVVLMVKSLIDRFLNIYSLWITRAGYVISAALALLMIVERY